jgi:VWFA-related protein
MAYPRTSRILAVLPFIALVPLAKAADKDAGAIPTFKSTTRVVLVDVVATDSSGQPVHDLKRNDFTVLDEGKPQGIVAFEEQRSDATPRPPVALNLPDHVYTNYVSRGDSGALTVLLFDSLNTDRQDLPNAKSKMLNFLKKLPPGKRVAVYALGSQLRMVQSFTENSDELIAAVQQLSTLSHSSYSNPKELSAAIGELKESAASKMSARAFSNLVGFLGEEYQSKGEWRSQYTLDAFTLLARALAIVPGRKNLIWISSGFPFDTSSNAPELRRVATLLAATRIAVYPVDVRGVVFTDADAQTRDSEIFLQTQPYGLASGSDLENSSIIETMENLASITGGRAHVNNNDLEGAIADSMQTGSNYYSVAYRPANTEWNGKFRKIAIKTSRRNVKLLYRSGYYATSDTFGSKDDVNGAVATAMQPSAPVSTQLIMKTRVVPPKAPDVATSIDMLIDVHDLTLTEEKGRKKPQVQFVAIAWDTTGKQCATFSGVVDAVLSPAQLDSLFRTGLQIHKEMVLKPGSYQLRLGVMDRLSGRIGTLDVPLTIGASGPAK